MNINIIPFVSFFFINSILSVYVLFKNPRSALNRLLFIFFLGSALWALALFLPQIVKNEILGFLVASSSTAALAITAALYLHFIMVFTERKKFLSRRINYFWMYSPAAVFAGLIWFSDLITVFPLTVKYGGYYREPAAFFGFFLLYLAAYFSSGLFICLKFYLKERASQKKEQARYVLVGSLIPFLIGLALEGALPVFGVYFDVRVGILVFLFWPCYVAYVVQKYSFLAIASPWAADSIILTIPDFLIVLDENLNISFVNPLTLKILGYAGEELKGRSFKLIISGEKYGEIEKAIRERPLVNLNVEYLTKNKEKISINLNSYPIFDKSNRYLAGVVIIGRDLRQINRYIKHLEESKGLLEEKNRQLEDLSNQLKEKYQAVERANKLMVEREIRMTELKKEIAELKEKKKTN